MHVTTILSVRILVALSTRTFFQPDEFFQALEPAHHAVFGYGDLTWEWCSTAPIRSIIYPAINIPAYWLLKVTGLHTWDSLLIAAPKTIHGLLAAGADIGVAELARAVLGRDYVATAVFLSLTSFFNALALSRSLSNSLETSLSALAFAYYPWDASSSLSPHIMYNRRKLVWSLLFSALACIIRPTNAIIWIFLYAKLLWSLHQYRKLALSFSRDLVATGIAAVLTLFLVDTLYYGRPILTPLNFLLANFSSVSLFYGSNPWHYYLTQALPILCTTALPFVAHGICTTAKCRDTPRRNVALETMLAAVVWFVGFYSFAGHKEWRFIHPILPLLHVFAAKSLVELGASSQPRTKTIQVLPIQKRHFVFLLLTIPVSIYVVLFYCSAPVAVLSYIRALSIPSDSTPFTDTIGFLMPCHSTPGQSHIHRKVLTDVPGRMWSLGCEPPLNISDISSYQDQTNVFYASPKTYLLTRFPPVVKPAFPPSPFSRSHPGQVGVQDWRHEWPKHLILFGDLLRDEFGVQDILVERGYREVWRRGRNWEGEGTRKGGVRVWKWSP